MDNSEHYYSAPSEEAFEELKKAAIKIWNTYDDDPSYADEKISRIEDLKNIKDNFMYMVAMFDSSNQEKLARMLTEATRKEVRSRMVAGGNPSYMIPF